MKAFTERALEHLSQYKIEVLKICEPGVYRYRNADKEKSHVLPLEKADCNLLELVRPYLRDLKDTKGSKLKKHRYFHHLNSSQALAINLFQPFLTAPNRRALLARLLKLRAPLNRAGFEHVPDELEGTNVDFFAEGKDGEGLLIEVKFTEREFGKAKDDARHREKYEKFYREPLKATTDLNDEEMAEFFSAYQFFRNAIHAGSKTHVPSHVWFLVPRENKAVREAAKKYSQRLKSEIVARVQVIELEKLLDEIEILVSSDAELIEHFAHFRRKYVVPAEDSPAMQT
jgi:hypothetical protein